MNSSLGLFNASASIISQPMAVPPLVSFRSLSAFREQKKSCPEGYAWGRYGCLRAIYGAVQRPGIIQHAFGVTMTPKPNKTRTPYTLPKPTAGAKPKGEAQAKSIDVKILVYGDDEDDETTPLPRWQPNWKRYQPKPKAYKPSWRNMNSRFLF